MFAVKCIEYFFSDYVDCFTKFGGSEINYLVWIVSWSGLRRCCSWSCSFSQSLNIPGPHGECPV